jgi:hypothetical protein
MAQTLETENIVKAIIDQKESLKHLIVMLESADVNEKAKFVIADLKHLYDAFNVAETKSNYDKSTLEPINTQIASLRKKLTTGV